MMTRDTLIYLAITRGKNRLEVSGSFELYQDFLRASLPALTAATIYTTRRKPMKSLKSPPKPKEKKHERTAK